MLQESSFVTLFRNPLIGQGSTVKVEYVRFVTAVNYRRTQSPDATQDNAMVSFDAGGVLRSGASWRGQAKR